MPDPDCDSCRRIFGENENNDKLANLLESKHPNCECEKCSVGIGSPSSVKDEELLHRIIISRRDFDPATGAILAAPFEKVFQKGVSVCRDIATDDDLRTLASEGFRSENDRVWLVCTVLTADLRASKDGQGERIFGVYDQTVSRRNLADPPVPTHAGIFQRLPPPNTPDGKKIRKDFARMLRDKFSNGRQDVTIFRNGLLEF